jgi:hypothetical protein
MVASDMALAPVKTEDSSRKGAKAQSSGNA